MAHKLGIEINKPRICGRRTRRENYNTDSCESYYRVSVYIPHIDMIIQDLKQRFSTEVLNIFNLPKLQPEYIIELRQNEDKHPLADTWLDPFSGILKTNKVTFFAELEH